MSRFASGKDSYAISDRSGFRYKYRDMRKEWNGLLVGKDEFEAKQPQLGPFRKVFDAQALKDARPPNPEPFAVLVGNPPLEDPNMALIKASAQVGQVIVDLPTITPSTATPTGLSATASVGTVTTTGVTINQTFAVTVQSYLGANKYYIDGVRQDTVTLTEGNTYRFDQSDGTNSGHPLRLSTTSDGTHGGGSQYTTGVTTTSSYTQITVAVGAPTLYYYCTNHSGMGGQANTP